MILVTGEGSGLATAIAAGLTAAGSQVRLVRLGGATADAREAMAELVDGVSQIILVEPALPLPEEGWLDLCTRCLYDLLMAAADAAVPVPRVVVLGSMDIFLPYPPNIGVMPVFQPLPSCDPAVLGPHMAEYVCREFAMCGTVEVLAARLGTLVETPPSMQAGQPPPRWWVQLDEAAEAIVEAVCAFTGPTPLSRRHSVAFDTINLAHGDDGPEFPPLAPKAANSGNPHWSPPPATAPAVSTPVEQLDKVVIFGGSGLMGPDVVINLAPPAELAHKQAQKVFELRITDVTERPNRRDQSQVKRSTGEAARGSAIDAQTAETDPRHEYMTVDLTSLEEVRTAAAGTDAIVVCSVSREHPVLAFEVNCRGVYNALVAAVENGHRRFINTGPWSVVGGHHRNWYHGLHENMPPQSGLSLYCFSKGLGHEVARIFSVNHDISVMSSMHGSFPTAEWNAENRGLGGDPGTNPGIGLREGDGLSQPLCSTYAEAAAVIRAMLEVDLARLPSRHEAFFVLPDVPDGVYSNAKARKILGWEPVHPLTSYFTRSKL